MKRGICDIQDKRMKKVKFDDDDEDNTQQYFPSGFLSLDENLLFEVLKHVDAKSLGMAGCVNKLWNKTANDERLWELICTRHLANMGCGNQQLRSVVLALGGFRRLHSHYLWAFSKQQRSSSSSASSSWAPLAPIIGQSSSSSSKNTASLGKDAVHLSLSLLSIKYYEKMNFVKRSS